MADGCEEIEGLTVVDIVRRAKLEIETISITEKAEVTSSHQVTFKTDTTKAQADFDSYDAIVLPGGMPGTLNLENSEQVQKAITYCAAHDKWIAAICAAPSILGHLGMLDGKNATCFEGFEAQLKGANVTGEPVCVDGRIITARGAGVALQFGLKLTQLLCGDAAYKKLHDSMLCE